MYGKLAKLAKEIKDKYENLPKQPKKIASRGPRFNINPISSLFLVEFNFRLKKQ